MTPTATKAVANINFLVGGMQSIAAKAKTNTEILTDDNLRREFSQNVKDEEDKLQDLAVSFGLDINPQTSCSSGGLLGLFKAVACAINKVDSLKISLLGTEPVAANIEAEAADIKAAAEDLEKEEKEEDDNQSMESAEKKTTNQQQSMSSEGDRSSTFASTRRSASTASSSVSSGAISLYNIFPTVSSQAQADETSMINNLKIVAAASSVLSVDWTDDGGSFHYALNAPLSPQQVDSLSSQYPVISHL